MIARVDFLGVKVPYAGGTRLADKFVQGEWTIYMDDEYIVLEKQNERIVVGNTPFAITLQSGATFVRSAPRAKKLTP